MLANFFGKSSPINFVIIVGVFLSYFFTSYFVNYNQVQLSEVVLLLPLILVVFFFYNFILFKNKLTLYNSYGFLFFVILFGLFSISSFDRNSILFHGLLLIFLRRVYSLRSSNNIFGKLFDSGFWLGIFFIFEPFSVLFGVLIYLSNSMFQKTNWQTFLIPLVGFFVPVFCAFTYYFWLEQEAIFYNYFDWYSSYDFGSYKNLEIQIPLAVVGMITLIALVVKTPKVIGISGSYRKYWTLVIVNLLVAVVFVCLLNQKNGVELQYLFFPISVIMTNWVEGLKSKIIKEIVLALSLVSPLILLIV